jgi:GSH-dependent disulfide-bond oxidoreductase
MADSDAHVVKLRSACSCGGVVRAALPVSVGRRSVSLHAAMPPYDFKPPDRIEELYAATAGNNFSSINAPTSGAREAAGPGPVPGTEALQLYSLATPNGWKVGLLLEELAEIDAATAPYDAHVINIGSGDQFSAEFVRANPNSKIPALVDREGPGGEEITVFESGSILLYLAEKYGHFLPLGAREKQECYNWLFWQMAGQGPMTG